jgi:hypothetical protein
VNTNREPRTEKGERFGSYSPDRRTALVLCGTGAHGAYHAGVLRALQEVGVRIDVMAGQGVGAGSAALAAIDGAGRLSDAGGVWRSPEASSCYGWTWRVRAAVGTLAAAVTMQAGALLAVALAVAPPWTQRLPAIALGVSVIGIAACVVAARWRGPATRRAEGAWWWRLLGAPVDAAFAHRLFARSIWNVIKGVTPIDQPASVALSRRYTELLQENLGQPGYRELVIVATDLDARRDLVAALLREPFRQAFLAPRPGRDRRAEVLDLCGVGRDHTMDVVAAALTPPVVCDPHAVPFAADSFWRGETHRACDRPGSVSRLLEEVAAAGVTQAIVVTAVSSSETPHRLRAARLDVRGRLGEFQSAAEAAALRDGLEMARLRFDAVYTISPAHNPVGPFDVAGAYDEASDRRQDLAELMERAYEDAYRQFIEPVVGASGEHLARSSGPEMSGPEMSGPEVLP